MSFKAGEGKLISIMRIFPNRYNPNDMAIEERLRLRLVMEKDEYDPIIVSPALTFYGNEVWKMEVEYDHPGKPINKMDDPTDSYIICDGYHRFMQAWWVGLKEIRCEVWNMTEDEAMPYFYSRHKLRGQLDPIKEALLFQHESVDNGLTNPEIVKKYNLTGVGYLEKRLYSVRGVEIRVIHLFYQPPEGAQGNLYLGHLHELSRVEKAFQYPLAHKCCMEGWTVRKLEEEVKNLRKKRGTFDESLSAARIRAVEEKRQLKDSEEEETLVRDEPLTDEELKAELEKVTGVDIQEDPPTLVDENAPKVIPAPSEWTREAPLKGREHKPRPQDYDTILLKFADSKEKKTKVRLKASAMPVSEICQMIQERIIFKNLDRRMRAYTRGQRIYLEKVKIPSFAPKPPPVKPERLLTVDDIVDVTEQLLKMMELRPGIDLNRVSYDEVLRDAQALVTKARASRDRDTLLEVLLKTIQAYLMEGEK